MSSKRAYAGNVRFIEIGAEGIPFRISLNLDQVENVRFEENLQEVEVLNDDAIELVVNEHGNVVTPARPATKRRERVSQGWCVVIQQAGQPAKIAFPDMAEAMSCYNTILRNIEAVGIPFVKCRPLVAPPGPENEVNGEAIADAVDAADLHPDLAGGEGGGIAPNDDDFEITDEDIELLDALGEDSQTPEH